MSEVSGADWFAIEDSRQLPVYSRLPIALVRGEGSFVWDSEGRRYLDFYGGHCVTALGHCPPRVVTAIQEQAAELLFYSNVVYSPVRDIGWTVRDGVLVIGFAIDNLLKGASSQAVQNMNLILELPETAGLLPSPSPQHIAHPEVVHV